MRCIQALFLVSLSAATMACSTFHQPRAVLQSSLSFEVLMAGQLDTQPASDKLGAKVDKKTNSRLAEIDKDGDLDRKVKAYTKKWLGIQARTQDYKPSDFVPVLRGESSDGTEVTAVGLRDAFLQLAANEATIRRHWKSVMARAILGGIEDRHEAATRRVFAAYLAKKLSIDKAFERVAVFESKRRNAREVAVTRLDRMLEISREKEKVYKELADQCLNAAVNQRVLTNHHLGFSLLSLEGLKYRYETYKAGFDRLKERIEKAYDEGREESKKRRARIEDSDSIFDKAKAAFK